MQGDLTVYLFIYFDDDRGSLTDLNERMVNNINIYKLGKEFPMRDIGKLSYFLGIEVEEMFSDLHLQTQYLVDGEGGNSVSYPNMS